MKKLGIYIVCFILVLSSGFTSIAWGAETVTSTTGKIGGRTFQLVYISPKSGITSQVALASNSVVSDKTTKAIIDTAASTSGKKVLAAVNGGYFNAYYVASKGISYPSNCPRVYATIIQNGKLINGGGTKQVATLGFDPSGVPLIDWVSFSPKVTFRNSVTVTPWGLNSYFSDAGAIMQFTDEMTLPVTTDSSSKIIYVKNGAVTDIADGGHFNVAAGQDVFVYNSGAIANAQQWESFPAVGDTVDFDIMASPKDTNFTEQWNSISQAVSVGPMILQDGVSVAGTDAVTEAKQSATAVNQKSFAAVMKDGRLLLGSGTGCYNDIASYLAGIGAVDAMSLDGGASSMLYTGAKGFLQKAGRNLSNILVFLSAPAANPGITAQPTPGTVFVDGKAISFESYNIGGSNYFKLRDLAMAFKDSDKKFEVSWDSKAKSIALLSGAAYTVAGGELLPGNGAVKSAVLSSSSLSKDGSSLKLTAYTINGNTYFKLRDIAKAFNIKVDWNDIQKAIEIQTAGSYTD